MLIIASDPERASRLVAACRRIDAQARYTSDPIHGLLRAMHEEPAMLLIDADDAWLGEVSVIHELRRHPALCFTPIMLLTRAMPQSFGMAQGADYVADLNSPNLASRIRACFASCQDPPARPSTRPSVIARAGRAAKRIANKVTWHLSTVQPETATISVALGDLLCEGNLFRRIGDPVALYELQISRERLMLLPIQRGLTAFQFEDAETLLEHFQSLPFA